MTRENLMVGSHKSQNANWDAGYDHTFGKHPNIGSSDYREVCGIVAPDCNIVIDKADNSYNCWNCNECCNFIEEN